MNKLQLLKQSLPNQGTILIKSLEDMGSHKKTCQESQ